jgi:hypothetical protein
MWWKNKKIMIGIILLSLFIIFLIIGFATNWFKGSDDGKKATFN